MEADTGPLIWVNKKRTCPVGKSFLDALARSSCVRGGFGQQWMPDSVG
jgi:hypothetical protein